MAIHHSPVKIIGRQVKDAAGKPVQGRNNSAVAASAYRGALKLRDERYNCIQDYSRKSKGVIHCEMLTPDGAPEWMQDAERLWNAVEAKEIRKDAQLAREMEGALPVELTDAQNLELARGFVRDQFVRRGMVAQLSIHEPKPKNGQRNPHAHILLTLRDIEGNGFGMKNRSWNSDEMLMSWRKAWADHCNAALEAGGHDGRIDHRSLKDQGIDRLPTRHLGRQATAMRERGERTRRGDQQKIVATLNATHGLELGDSDDSELARKRRGWEDLSYHARRAARDSAKASRDLLHDSTPGKERGTYTKKEAIDRAAHTPPSWQEREAVRQREREFEPER